MEIVDVKMIDKLLEAGSLIGVRREDVRVETLRPGRGKLNSVWVQCPSVLAEKFTEEGRIRLEWSSSPSQVLPPVFSVLGGWLYAGYCRNAEDRSFLCFNCDQKGHRAFGCRAKSYCLVCARIECHRAGSAECPPFNERVA